VKHFCLVIVRMSNVIEDCECNCEDEDLIESKCEVEDEEYCEDYSFDNDDDKTEKHMENELRVDPQNEVQVVPAGELST